MKEFVEKYKGYLDYLPIMLLTLLFIAEAELEHHAVHLSCQMAITIITLSIFFLIVLNVENAKTLAFIIALTFWIVLTYCKSKLIIKSV